MMNIICRKFGYYSLLFGKHLATTRTRNYIDKSLERLCSTMSNKPLDIGKEKTVLYNALPRIIDDLIKHSKFEEIPIAEEWVKKVMNGTLTGGKCARALTTVIAYKTVEKTENINDETIRLAHSLAWCNEIFHTYCVLLDDIADGSSTRRGQPCWYKREDVGIAHATNDSVLLVTCMHKILQNNFEKSSIYNKLYRTYNECLLYTSFGQHLDIRGSTHEKNYNLFTIENYDDIVKYKSSYYTYLLPISVGLMLANHLDADSFEKCKEISFQLGSLFQMQDDFLDCFGDETFIGKVGTDIQTGKCSWLAVKALSLCDAKNRAVFSACYGSAEPAHIERIKQMYVQLQIPHHYKQKEIEISNSILSTVEAIPSAPERKLYRLILDMTYDRKK